MFQLASKNPPVASEAPVAKTVVLAAFTPAMESLADSLAQTYPHVAVAKTVAALETQQLDHSAQMAAIDDIKDTIDKYDEDHPHTGPLHVYLLDGRGAALMDQEDGDTPVRALVNAAMRDKRKIVAALMPEDVKYKSSDDIMPSTLLRQLADTILSTENITVLVGKEAFESFLANPEIVLAPSQEAQPASEEPTEPVAE